MKRKIFILLLIVSFIAKADILTSKYFTVLSHVVEKEPTLESVLNHYYVAVAGSKEKLQQITSLISEGQITFPQLSESADIEIKYKAPNKYISKISIMGQTIIKGFDGQKLFSNVPVNNEDELKEIKMKKGIFSELYVTQDNAVLEGKKNLDGKEVYKVTVIEDNIKTIFYFDVKTGLKIKEETLKGTEVLIKEYADYKDFEGYKLSTKIKTQVTGQTAVQTITKYEINPKLDDSQFKL
ncbi:MAG: hypothetical protein J6581_06810 [Apibacter sp.]|jgi:hypothetical protein|nr:hypothetical protein [Apibacter sp.]